MYNKTRSLILINLFNVLTFEKTPLLLKLCCCRVGVGLLRASKIIASRYVNDPFKHDLYIIHTLK